MEVNGQLHPQEKSHWYPLDRKLGDRLHKVSFLELRKKNPCRGTKKFHKPDFNSQLPFVISQQLCKFSYFPASLLPEAHMGLHSPATEIQAFLYDALT
jgi:hypothetical protein